MFSRFHSRNSAITFDVGTAGIRAYQVTSRAGHLLNRESMLVELPPSRSEGNDAPPTPDYSRLARMVGQGSFLGSEIALVLSPPDVGFCTLRIPKKALDQPEQRLRQALAWEVAREIRAEAQELEVRYWRLPPGHHQGMNVMAVALPTKQAYDWYELFKREGLYLRRIDVAPCALVHLASRMWAPDENDLWGVLDLGFRRSTLTVVLGRVPVYIRSLAVSSDAWTRRLVDGFEVSRSGAEQIKRAHGIRQSSRGIRPALDNRSLLDAQDTPAVIFGLLREPIDDLVHQISKCFGYVMQSYSEVVATRLMLTGGGANLIGLTDYLELQLDMPVGRLSANEKTASENPAAEDDPNARRWENPIPIPTLVPELAAAVGGALLDLESK